jgi:ADP-heptose:LPS heptosyltransferase
VEQDSTVLACAAIRRAIDLVGRENVFFLVFEENRFILDVMGLVPPENVLAIRNDKLLTAAADTVRAVKTVRRRRVNAVIDLEIFARSSAALSYLTGCDHRVGFHGSAGEGPYRGDLMTHRRRYNPHLHTSQTFCMMVEALTFAPTDLTPFDVTPAAADDPPPILVPTESGAPSEAEAAASLVKQIGSERCFSLAGATTLRQLLVIFGLADVLVTNDSGPAHFAALTPIDVVTLFGPETPHLYGHVRRETTCSGRVSLAVLASVR